MQKMSRRFTTLRTTIREILTQLLQNQVLRWSATVDVNHDDLNVRLGKS